MAHLLIGTLIATATAAALWLAGLPLWLALLVYCFGGVIGAVISAAIFVFAPRPARKEVAHSTGNLQAENA